MEIAGQTSRCQESDGVKPEDTMLVHPHTLGVVAVARANHLAVLEVGEGTDQVVSYRQRGTPDMPRVGKIREQLLGLPSDYDTLFDDYCDVSAPITLRHAKSNCDADLQAPANWRLWLGHQSSDRQFVNFLQWNIAIHAETQEHPEVAAEVEQQLAQYKEGVQQGVKDGWLHPDALDAVNELDSIKVYVGDPFDTQFLNRAGYHQRGSSDIVLSADLTRATLKEGVIAQIRSSTKHELTHAKLGSLGDDEYRRWIDEAGTEHIACSLDYGSPELLSLYKRPNPRQGVYRSERELLNMLLMNGKFEIPVAAMTLAYSERRTSSARDRFENLLNESWKEYDIKQSAVTNAVSSYIAKEEEAHLGYGMSPAKAAEMAIINAEIVFRESPETVLCSSVSAPQTIEQAAARANIERE